METTTHTKKVGMLLCLGIIIAPIIFAWMLLNKGYSATARFLGFGWMVAFFLIISGTNSDHSQQSTQTIEKWYASDVESFSLNLVPYEYKDDIKNRLRDPKSFEFISVDWYVVDSTNIKATKKVLKSYRIKPKVDSTMMVFIDYRARNGFGGMNADIATFVVTPTTRTFLQTE